MDLSRRRFLQVLGIGAGAAAVAPHILKPQEVEAGAETLVELQPQQLPIGEAGQVLRVDDNGPQWTQPLTSTGDIILGNMDGYIPIWRAPEHTRPAGVYHTLSFDPERKRVMIRTLGEAWTPLDRHNESKVLADWGKYYDLSPFGLPSGE